MRSQGNGGSSKRGRPTTTTTTSTRERARGLATAETTTVGDEERVEELQRAVKRMNTGNGSRGVLHDVDEDDEAAPNRVETETTNDEPNDDDERQRQRGGGRFRNGWNGVMERAVSTYAEVNAMLRALHFERLRRARERNASDE
jgi:hypothetical protein